MMYVHEEFWRVYLKTIFFKLYSHLQVDSTSFMLLIDILV